MRWRSVRPSSGLILLLAVVLGALTLIPAVGGPLDRSLETWRFGVHIRQASGQTVLVEMDAASAQAMQRWPWPRRHYAAVVDRLRAAGAQLIVFDVDLSSSSDRQDDAMLAAALARAQGQVALPTFGQQAGSGDRRRLDALPLPAFRDHAALASVSMSPDVDGLVRAMPLATMTVGIPRPSLSAFIAARNGQADDTFPIDFSIDPASIPRLSFMAVRDGRFDAAAVRGRSVLIGATAIEMGDRYATATRGVLPGVVIQALAAETLIAGMPSRGSGWMTLALAMMLAAWMVAARSSPSIAGRAVGSAVALIVGVLAAQYRLAAIYPLAPGLIALLAAAICCLTRDILGRRWAERLTDAATGLPNQRAFLAASIATASDVVLVQINNFDALAAVLGGAESDQVVVRVAERLRLLTPTRIVFRVRSHHLALVLSNEQPASDSMDALRVMLREPIEVGGRKIDVLVTAGVAGDGRSDVRLADAAIAAAAAAREGAFWRRVADDHAALERSVSLMGELDAAIVSGDLIVHYQPKLRLASGRIESAEALVRWRHPTRGVIGPDLFIPLAEQSDRIEPLTLHVLATVLTDVERWRARGHAMTAAVNISAKLLSSTSFNQAVDKLLAAVPVPTSSLIFEVTESAAMTDPAGAVATLQRYRDRGIAVSMDDYGTGQSTLTYLRRLPLSELKIDRSFVQHVHERPADALLVRSTIDLAHQLGLKVVAEGVEDAAGLAFLRDQGCDYVQGYLVSRPVPVDVFLDLVGEPSAIALRAVA